MRRKSTPSEKKWKPSVGDYVAICDRQDEFDGVIGIVEELVLEPEDEPPFAIIMVPTALSELRSRKMVGVNDLMPYVRYQLRENQNRIKIAVKNLESVNTEDF